MLRDGLSMHALLMYLQEINDWLKDPFSDSVFWLCSEAGTGKSTIISSLWNRLNSSGSVLGVFLCRADDEDRSNTVNLIKSLAHQIALTSRECQDEVNKGLKDLGAMVCIVIAQVPQSYLMLD